MLPLEILAHIMQYMPLEHRRQFVHGIALVLNREGIRLPATSYLCLLAAPVDVLCALPFHAAEVSAEIGRRIRAQNSSVPPSINIASYAYLHEYVAGGGSISWNITLAFAAYYGRVPLVAQCIQAGATNFNQAVAFAAFNNQHLAVKYLSPQASDTEWALKSACLKGYTSMAYALIGSSTDMRMLARAVCSAVAGGQCPLANDITRRHKIPEYLILCELVGFDINVSHVAAWADEQHITVYQWAQGIVAAVSAGNVPTAQYFMQQWAAASTN